MAGGRSLERPPVCGLSMTWGGGESVWGPLSPPMSPVVLGFGDDHGWHAQGAAFSTICGCSSNIKWTTNPGPAPIRPTCTDIRRRMTLSAMDWVIRKTWPRRAKQGVNGDPPGSPATKRPSRVGRHRPDPPRPEARIGTHPLAAATVQMQSASAKRQSRHLQTSRN